MSPATWEVVVVGAGPAGAVAATLLAQRDIEVLLVDKQEFPRAKVCGGCVSARAVNVLHRIGSAERVLTAMGTPLHRLLVSSGSRNAEFQLHGGLAVERSEFDAELVRIAIDAGVQFRSETTATLTECNQDFQFLTLKQKDRVDSIQARVVVAADGISQGLRGKPAATLQVIDARSYLGAGVILPDSTLALGQGELSMSCADHGYVGAVRLPSGTLVLAAALLPVSVRTSGGLGAALQRIVAKDPLYKNFSLAELDWQGTPLLSRHPQECAAERLFAIGDAAGFIEPFTGEGIAWALESAELAAPLVELAVSGWQPILAQQWSQLHARKLGGRHRRCRLMTYSLRNPILRNSLLWAATTSMFPKRSLVTYFHGSEEQRSVYGDRTVMQKLM